MPNDMFPPPMVSLDDKYDLSKDRVFVNGNQALVRMCLMQAALDKRAGLNTGGYVTGYRGSPVGGLDVQFNQAHSVLKAADIKFQEGLNEDLAATAIWGTQQVAMRGEGAKDGVFSIWYGKGPGVDRSGDVFRHANLAGTAEHGGVLVLMGDDHTAESSTTCHQSEYALVDAMMPILNPANIAEFVDYGLKGWAMSRATGLWVGMKCVKDNIESSGSVDMPLDRARAMVPAGMGGMNIRPSDDRHAQERRLHREKIPAVLEFARANGIDQMVWDGGKNASIGVISTGKSWMDVEQALRDLGVDKTRAAELGIRTYKVGMPWPLEPQGIKEFAKGLSTIIVVEEKRALIETQLKDILFATDMRPQVVGKYDASGAVLFPADGALTSVDVARALADRCDGLAAARSTFDAIAGSNTPDMAVARQPYFCAGCPHNRSTVLPKGARGYAGIGCHWMALFMDRGSEGYTHMGGEGANWIGEAPFSIRGHVFQNLGDGTFNHSGLMAIRAAIGAGVNMTYKILYNDAVAMTGGQTHDGGLSPRDIAAQVMAAGATRLEVVSDRPQDFDLTGFAPGTQVHHRDNLNAVQSALAQVPGVSILLYEQTCATEKRRRRKRGLMDDPAERVFINPEVCEGCGDCGLQSNCVAILPLETELGTKRQIDQSACNKDFSCVKGFCPSFVTVKGGELRKPTPVGFAAGGDPSDPIPDPDMQVGLDAPLSIVLTGVGGTGVVTIGAILGMAAHIEGKGVGLIDMAGLAQKGGAVTSHIRLAASPDHISAIRIAPGGADLLLGCDGLVSAGAPVLKLLKNTAHVVANTFEMVTGAFVKDRDFRLPCDEITARLQQAVPEGQAHLVDATSIAKQIMGDTIGANMFLLGAAWQKGLVPIGRAALRDAIALNGVAVAFNQRAFDLGRHWANDPQPFGWFGPHRGRTPRANTRCDYTGPNPAVGGLSKPNLCPKLCRFYGRRAGANQ